MWYNELGLVYEEYVMGSPQTTRSKYTPDPLVTNPNLSIRNVKIGTHEPNLYASSEAGNVAFGNPYEQEEVQESLYTALLEYVDDLLLELDADSVYDRSAILALSKIKNKLNN